MKYIFLRVKNFFSFFGKSPTSREKADRVSDVMIARYDQTLRALHDR
jgi:hypothetical protein